MKIAIIGAGNMGGAIARGLLKSGKCSPNQIICTAKSKTTLDRMLAYNPALQVTQNNLEAARQASLIIVAVKPWFVGDVLREIAPVVEHNPTMILSVAAGITLEELEGMLTSGKNQENSATTDAESNLSQVAKSTPTLFRVVPNTAIEVLEGVTFISSHDATAEQRECVESLFSAMGYAATIDEKLISAATSLASCGIAYAMRYIRAAAEGGVELGFRPDEAARIVEHTVKGAAALLLSSGQHPEVEIDKVTTAGGITIKGLNAMEQAGFSAAVIEGLKASK